MKDRCDICRKVKPIKLLPCKICGNEPRVGHFNVMVDWHVNCECGVSIGDYSSYRKVVMTWNRLMENKK